jgi:hypothetical protein
MPNVLSGSDETITSVSCTSPYSCVAVGTSGKILTTSDGVTWNLQGSPTTQVLFGLTCVSTEACIAVGTNGTALTYSAGVWQTRPTGTTNTLSAVKCQSSNICIAVGRNGTVVASTNFGVTWAVKTSGVTAYLYGIDCAPGGAVCLAVGAGGTVIMSRDGTSWSPVQSPTLYRLRSVAVFNSGQVWVGGNGGTILVNPRVFSARVNQYFHWFDLATPGMVGDNIHLLNTSAATANVAVTMPGADPINIAVPSGVERYVTFGPGHIGGPVVVSSDQVILSSQRVQYYQSFNEVWAMTADQTSTVSYLTWFDKASPGMVGDNIHILNPGSVAANVTIYGPNALTLTVAPGAESYATFPSGTIGGPIQVSSDQPVLSSQRVQYYQSFSEIGALSPYNAATTSYFNWFDKATPGMVNDNIHILNPSLNTATGYVDLGYGNRIPFTLASGQAGYVTYPRGSIGGAVTVQADQPVLATQRVQYYQTFNEVPAAPWFQAANVSHVMWFDKATPGMVGDNIHVLNPSWYYTTANVTVSMPGAADITFTLLSGEEKYVNFPLGTIGGPVTITADKPVLAAQRVQYYQTFNEVWAA